MMMQKLQSENSHAHLMGVSSGPGGSNQNKGGAQSDNDSANMSQQ
jgi:hypothetical protein